MARVYNVFTGACVALLQGHDNEISKISFNPQGNKIITFINCQKGFWYLPIPEGGQANTFQNGYLSLHTPDMHVAPMPVMQGDLAGDLSKQHLKQIA